MQKKRAEAKLEEYTKKAESAKRQILELEKELEKTKHTTYPTNIHGNPEHVPETTIVYDTTMEKVDLIYDILNTSYKYSIDKMNKNPKIGEQTLTATLGLVDKKDVKSVAKILGVSFEELNFHSFLILTTDNVPTISNSIKQNGYIPEQSFMGRFFS